MPSAAATSEATAHHFERRGPLHSSKVRLFDGLSLSALGIGAHLGAPDETTDRLYERALIEAAKAGVNVFDTALIDRGMRSEKLLGRVLKELNALNFLREELFIATKGGYLPFDGPLEAFADFVRAHYFDTGLIEPSDVVGERHCMAPRFLENQIETSLENLGLKTLDLYWLHNPEVELLELGEEVFYPRLKRAFALCEKMVAEKKIARYGIASWNGFRVKKKALQLHKILAAAKEAGGENHHFKALLVPLNLIMLEVLKVANQGSEKVAKKFMQTVKESGLALFSSAPLMQGQVLELPDQVFTRLPLEKSQCLQALQFVLSTPGLTGTFLSVKQPSHWEEVKEILQLPIWDKESWKKASLSLGL